jgi:hypothetical protein
MTTLASQMPGPLTRINSTWGKIGLFQVFDYSMTASQIEADAHRYGLVWGSGHPYAWDAGNPGALVSAYMVMENDPYVSGHTLKWWQTNHPNWILYGCDSTGNPTHELAYAESAMPDVPLDIHNPSVVNYQIRQVMGPYAIAHGFNALAIDQFDFYNFMEAGNPEFGEKVYSGYYACGIWNNGSFVRRYYGSKDPAWTSDSLAWMKSARSILKTDATLAPHHLSLVVNHPFGYVGNPNEQELIGSVDAIEDEVGFANYGYYQQEADAGLFKTTVDYMRAAQKAGVATLIIDKFTQDKNTITPGHLEYAIATYLMGNEQGAALFASPGNGYGDDQFHPEYSTDVGAPCGDYYGGPSYDPADPRIYYRKFASALIVVNSGSLPRTSEMAHLPRGHTYRDLEGRSVSNPLTVRSNDAYVLLTNSGCM